MINPMWYLLLAAVLWHVLILLWIRYRATDVKDAIHSNDFIEYRVLEEDE